MFGLSSKSEPRLELEAITEKDEIVKQKDRLSARLREGATEFQDFVLDVPGKPTPVPALWHAKQKFWVTHEHYDTTKRLDHKAFFTYGVESPAEASRQPLQFQINISWGSLNSIKLTAGSFARDAGGHIYYLHTGKVSKAPNFSRKYKGRRAKVTWAPGNVDTRFVVGSLDSGAFIKDLATYVHAVMDAINGTEPKEFEYRETINDSVTDAVDELEDAGVNSEANTALGTRLRNLKEIQTWLGGDPNLLDGPVSAVTEKALRDHHYQRRWTIIGAEASLVAGWLLSAINPHDILHGLAAGVGSLMALVH